MQQRPQTQVEIERLMFEGGVSRANGMLDKAEAGGRASDMPYAKEIFRDYVVPLAKAIDEDVNSGKAGSKMAHACLLRGLDLEAVAYLSLRYVLGTQLSSKAENHRQLVYGIGRTIHTKLRPSTQSCTIPWCVT